MLDSVADLQIGQSRKVRQIIDDENLSRLFEMGFVPGAEIKLHKIAPLGCPLVLRIDNEYEVSIRKSDAKKILLFP